MDSSRTRLHLHSQFHSMLLTYALWAWLRLTLGAFKEFLAHVPLPKLDWQHLLLCICLFPVRVHIVLTHLQSLGGHLFSMTNSFIITSYRSLSFMYFGVNCIRSWYKFIQIFFELSCRYSSCVFISVPGQLSYTYGQKFSFLYVCL